MGEGAERITSEDDWSQFLTGEISQIVSIQVDISGVHGDGVRRWPVEPRIENIKSPSFPSEQYNIALEISSSAIAAKIDKYCHVEASDIWIWF